MFVEDVPHVTGLEHSVPVPVQHTHLVQNTLHPPLVDQVRITIYLVPGIVGIRWS